MTKNYQKLSIGISLGLFFVVILILALINSYSYSDTDLGWHLRVGNDIAESQQVPSINYYNYTLAGDKWVDHEWLLNYGIYKIFTITDYTGLHVLFALLVVLLVYLGRQRALLLQDKNFTANTISLMLMIFALWASRPHLGIRVQEFALLLTIYVLYAIDLFPNKKRLFWLLPLVFIFWANVHGSFLLGLSILFAFSAYLWLQKCLGMIKPLKSVLLKEYSKQDKITSSLVFVFSLLGTLINPYGLKLYEFLGGYANTFYMTHISEWQGQASIPLYYPQLLYLTVIVSVVSVFLYIHKEKKINQSLWDWGVSVLFFILALKSRRHFPLFAFASLPLFYLAVQQIFFSIKFTVNKKFRAIIFTVILLLSAGGLVWLSLQIPFSQDSIMDSCETKYPCAAVSFLKQQTELKDFKLLNEFNWGGYLLYAYPERQIFIDGRMPQATYKDHTILEEYSQFKSPGADYKYLLAKHDIKLALLYSADRQITVSKFEKLLLHIKPEELVVNSYLRDYMHDSLEWEEIYRDNLSIIFVKKQ